ncbi:hypothetical protein [Pseudooceanicola sp. 200-1SW]|uniref:hypothetical protein n=1 Tax=Pseudooceanicola sp. 200-1SW TaxID=3425949 RepID=UPI003D7F4C35
MVDLLLILGLPLIIGLIVAVASFRWALEDELGLAFSLPAIGLFTVVPLMLLPARAQVPGMNAPILPDLIHMLGWALLILGGAGALLGWLIAELRG